MSKDVRRGGKRPGAGRKRSETEKVIITVNMDRVKKEIIDTWCGLLKVSRSSFIEELMTRYGNDLYSEKIRQI